jgi:PAS domain S-box-containing protein
MPRYSIDVYDGIRLNRRDSRDYTNVFDAQREAVWVLSEFAQDVQGDFPLKQMVSLLRDEAGAVVFEAALDLRSETPRPVKSTRPTAPEVSREPAPRCDGLTEVDANQFQILVQNVSDYAIYMLDTQGHVISWNAGGERIKGYQPDEIIGHHFSCFYTDEDRAAGVPEKALAAVVANSRFEGTGWRVRKDGSRFVANVVIDPIFGPSGEIVAFAKITRDITERKQAEELLNQTRESLLAEALRFRDEADRANQMKSAFLAEMSHEIRTPMNGILGMTTLLLRSNLDSAQRRFANAIDLSGRTLLKLINTLLEVAKFGSNKVELELVDFFIGEWAEQIVFLFRPLADQKGIALRVHIDESATPLVTGDPARLGQVLQNLLSNAIKFTDHGEVVLTIQGRAEGQDRLGLCIAVQDTGCGFSEEVGARLFQPYVQADETITRQYGGTGLGLVVCKQIIALMSGTISVQSEPGRGSLFQIQISLPLPIKAPSVAGSKSAVLQGRRVAIVDDNDVNRLVFDRYLTNAGMVVTGLESGQQALSLILDGPADAAPFDIIITDYYMPGLNGPDLARRLRGQLGDRTPSLVLVSFHDIPKPAAPDVGLFDAYLTKPLRGSALVDCVTRLLGPSRHMPLPSPPMEVMQGRGLQHVGLRDKRILVVDDNEINRLIAASLLQQAGCIVETATNGREAVEAVNHDDFAMVFMDIRMPGMDGLEATAAIRGLSDGRHDIPIIALTANAMATDREFYLRSGMDDYVSKPLDPDSFVAMAAKWVAGAPMAGMGAPEALLERPIDVIPILDSTTLDDLRSALPEDSFGLILRRFLASPIFAEIAASHLAQDFATTQRIAHSIRGACSSFGALRLAAIARQIEAACQRDDAPSLSALMPQLQQIAHETHDALRAVQVMV